MRISKSKQRASVDELLVRTVLATYGFAPTHPQIQLVQRYVYLLLLWNQKISLTSLAGPRQILERHFGESIFAVQFVPLASGRLADVGSGAGFPGMALKIARQELDVTLVEANHKKAAFLAEVKRSLRLEGVEIICSRMEELAVQPGFADFVSARAVGSLRQLLLWSSRALHSNGKLLLWLGVDDAIRVAGAAGWLWRKPVPIPNSRRRVLLIGEPASS